MTIKYIVRLSVVFILAFLIIVPSEAGKRRRRLRAIKANVTEQKISKKAVPAEELQSFGEHYPNATIKGQTKAKSEGVVYYEIESMDGPGTRTVSFKPDGTVV